MIPLFEFLASRCVAITAHKAAAKPVDRTLKASAIMPDIKNIARPGNFPFSGPILTSGTILAIRFILI